MTISFDIDGILCVEGDRRAIEGAQESVDTVLRKGHSVIYWTARPEIDRLKTAQWLSDNGFPNSPLFMGKPQAHIYVDDRAVSSIEDLMELL